MEKVTGIGGYFFGRASRKRCRNGIAIILAWMSCRQTTMCLRGGSKRARRL